MHVEYLMFMSYDLDEHYFKAMLRPFTLWLERVGKNYVGFILRNEFEWEFE